MQINRYVNGEKTKGIPEQMVANKEIREVIREVERRIRTAEGKA